MKNPLSQLRKAIATIGDKRSPHWPEVRKKWLTDHPTCAACGSAKNLEVHHMKPFHLYPALELDPSNFITLCEPIGVEHHLKVGHTVGGKSNWKLFNPDVEQDAARMLAQSIQ